MVMVCSQSPMEYYIIEWVGRGEVRRHDLLGSD